ncbi:opsin-5-like [Liolophura sinensis]|uniref:opsin-5-like n=1 Tax=Liolophura sinensis TaxID=3198878 RepID=UPI0031589D8C
MSPRLDMINFTDKITASASTESISKLSPNWDFVVALYSVSIATSSLCLNGILLSVAYRKRKRLRIIECLIINLAVSDIGLALTVFPLFIYSNINHRWSFGDAGCRYFAFMSFSLGVASMMSLAEIAFMRYQMVCKSSASCTPCHVYRGRLSDKVMLIVFPYLHGITWASGPFFGWGEYGYTPYGTACSLFWDMRNLSFLVSACIFCLAVPVGIMVFSYSKIIQKKNKSDRSMKTMSMCAAFVIAWTPYAIVGLLTMVIPLKEFPMPMQQFYRKQAVGVQVDQEFIWDKTDAQLLPHCLIERRLPHAATTKPVEGDVQP